MKTIFVVFSNTKLSKEQIRRIKKYSFNTKSDVKEGDIIQTSKYDTNLQVVNVLDKSYKYYNAFTGDLNDVLISSSQHEIVQLELRNDDNEIVYGKIVEI